MQEEREREEAREERKDTWEAREGRGDGLGKVKVGR